MSGRLENRAAIITGGAGGIGAATGSLFCEQGASVMLVDSDSDAMMVHFVGKPGTVARIERQRNPGPLCPDIAFALSGLRLKIAAARGVRSAR